MLNIEYVGAVKIFKLGLARIATDGNYLGPSIFASDSFSMRIGQLQALGFLNGSCSSPRKPASRSRFYALICVWLQCFPKKAHQFASHCNRYDFGWLPVNEMFESFVTTFLSPLTHGYR